MFPEFISKAEMCVRGRWAEAQRGNNLPWSSSPKKNGVVRASAHKRDLSASVPVVSARLVLGDSALALAE